MKKTLVVLLAVAISCCISSGSFASTDAQVNKAKNVEKKVKQVSAKEKMMPAPEIQLSRLTEGLQLTSEQQKLIAPILNDEYARLKAIRTDEDLSPKQIQIKVEALRSETVAKIHTFLTPAQIEKHNMVSDEIKSNKQKRMKENRNDRLGTKSDPPVQQIRK